MHASGIATIVWQPVFEPTLILGLGALLIILALTAYGRSIKDGYARVVLFLLMRISVIALLTALLMGPSAMPERVASDAPPRLNILLDTSGSMQTQDADGSGRLAYLQKHWLSASQVADLEAYFDTRWFTLDDDATALSPDRLRNDASTLINGSATHYRAALEDLLTTLSTGNASGAGILVFGDGHETDDQPLGGVADLARARGVKVNAVSVGNPNPPPDLAVVAIPQQDYLMPNESGGLLIHLYQSGSGSGTASVRIEKPDGQTLHETIALGGRGSASLTIPITHERAGRYEYKVSAAALPSETATGNNTHTAFVDVVQKGMRVLILEGEPYWDTKFLAQALRTDPRIEMDHIAQINPKKRQNIATRPSGDGPKSLALPKSAEDLAAYDAIVLGRGIEHLMSVETIQKLEAYVSLAGGNVIFARGLAYDPNTPEGQAARIALGVIEPVIWGQGVMNHLGVRLTEAGISNPCFAFTGFDESPAAVVSSLPPLGSLPVIDSIKPGTSVLARVGVQGLSDESEAPPAIVTMAYGRGRVFAVLGEGLWRWSFLPPEKAKLRGVFESFWSNTVRWLVMGGAFEPGREAALGLGRLSMRAGDEQVVEVATKKAPKAPPRLWVTDPEGREREVDLHRVAGMGTAYRASFKPESPGVWRVRAEAPGLESDHLNEAFSVYELDLERLRAGARPDVLKDLVDRTGGVYYRAEDRVNLGARLDRLRVTSFVPPKPIYIWDRPWVLVALLLWMGLEWLGRRKAGWL